MSEVLKRMTLILGMMLPVVVLAQNAKDGNGKKHGPWKETFEGSKMVKYSGTYDHGVRTGKFLYYYPDGKLMAIYTFSDKGKVARAKMVHGDGVTVKAVGKYINQERDSVWTFYNQDGIMISREGYKNGKYHGDVISYVATSKAEEGQHMLYKFSYKNGQLDGQYKRFYATGQVQEEGKYTDGQRVGTFTHYYSNGKTARKELYKHGVRHGIWLYYKEDGSLAKRRVFWMNKELEGKAAEAKIEAIKSGKETW